ncbi:5-oxoprolinase subunit PxpA [Amnibacterium flavum]|uniref:LamB/YcsF family protein n=1 Tax=Amnibacterium flavum TaxID=2173173 RepID=A0A2V1HVB9_9MICO|nr:5-oxoprolinase subunit PxpA [Amnibacterium flavum]PVZ94999.1 LamB/YcsF family protein [Amnibacterium flavum]
MAVLDLNCDLGEEVGDDDALFPLVTSANIACGFHAGDAATMTRSVALALANEVAIGAHPSYRDREGFGRREMSPPFAALVDDLAEQVDALTRIAADSGARLAYLKPHGALYNRIVHDDLQARAVAEVARVSGLPLLGMSGSALERAAAAAGSGFFREAFGDRAYLPDGTLAPRTVAGAVITDPARVAERVLRMAESRSVVATDGSIVPLEVDSVCLHGDTDDAVAIARAVRAALTGSGVLLAAFS